MTITTGRAVARVFAICVLLISFAGCTSVKLPNVSSFTDGTATLYQANASEARSVLSMYDDTIDLSKDVLRQSDVRLPRPERDLITAIQARLTAGKAAYAGSAKVLDKVLQQTVAYSERLAELAAAGETGAESAMALAGSINQFGKLFGPGEVLTGQVSDALQKIADHHTRVEAQQSLHDAASVAQGAVVEMAELLSLRHVAQQRLVSSLASDYDDLLSYAAGKSIIGYYREANDRRDKFYRRALLALRLNDDGISGFCRNPDTGQIDPDCINLSEMQALREVEDRLAVLQPEIAAYEAKRNAMQAWRNTRRANGASMVKAVNAWAREHQNVVDALRSGGGVSTFSLRAILAEIKNTQ